jgi:hypothetical protein
MASSESELALLRAKKLLAHDLFDQPLPGDLEERLDTFSAVEMLELLYPLV